MCCRFGGRTLDNRVGLLREMYRTHRSMLTGVIRRCTPRRSPPVLDCVCENGTLGDRNRLWAVVIFERLSERF